MFLFLDPATLYGVLPVTQGQASTHLAIPPMPALAGFPLSSSSC